MIKLIKNLVLIFIRNLPINIFFLFFLKSALNFNRKNSKIKILVLNYERFAYDIEVLSKNKNIEIIILNSKLQAFINNLWMHNTRLIFKNWRKKNILNPYNTYYFSDNDNVIIESRNNLKNYLIKIIKFFKDKLHISHIITCSVWYIQDKEWERASNELNFSFISIHKECMFDKDVIEREIEAKKRMNCKTYNSKVILYNEKARDVLIKSGIVNKKNTYVFGSMRMDYLFELQNKKNNKKNNQITIFSFNHRNGLVDFIHQNTNKSFSNSPKEGFHDLFDSFHGEIANLAIKFPNLKFVIKVKWEHEWINRINESFFKKTKKFIKDIKNLDVVCNANTHDLIFNSDLIMSFNSSTVVESVALKKPVIVPLFDEAHQLSGKLYDKHVYFKDYFNQFYIAQSSDDLEKYLLRFLRNDLPIKKIDNNFIEYYIGKVDGKCSDRLLNFILNNR